MMNLKLYGLTFGVLTMAGLAIGAAPDTSKLPPAADKKNVTYSEDIQSIFKESCYGCHGAERQKGGLRLDSLEAVLKGSKEGVVIVPSKGEKSKLLIAVARLDEKDAMPPAFKPRGQGGPGGPGGPGGNPPPGGPGAGPGRPGGPGGPGAPPKPLTTEQVSLIRAWIDQGAK